MSLVEQNEQEARIRFSVTDTGIGIAQEYIDQIFESFTQAGTDVARRFGGTGLGLAIAKHIMLSHGGHIRVESELGKGAHFFLAFPR